MASTETPEVSQGPRLLVPRTGTARAFSGGFGTGGIWTLLEKAIPGEGEVGWGLRVRGWSLRARVSCSGLLRTRLPRRIVLSEEAREREGVGWEGQASGQAGEGRWVVVGETGAGPAPRSSGSRRGAPGGLSRGRKAEWVPGCSLLFTDGGFGDLRASHWGAFFLPRLSVRRHHASFATVAGGPLTSTGAAVLLSEDQGGFTQYVLLRSSPLSSKSRRALGPLAGTASVSPELPRRPAALLSPRPLSRVWQPLWR